MYRIYVDEVGGVWFAVALGDDERIAASGFSCKGRRDVISSILESLPVDSSFSEAKPDGKALDILRSMHLIYEGKPVKQEFKFDMDRLPSFTKRALLMTYRIPRGYVSTYGGIAEALGDKAAARAVGNAEASNPFAPLVPCHRVVDSDLGLGGYGGGLDVKRAILEREGVVFTGNSVSRASLWISKK